MFNKISWRSEKYFITFIFKHLTSGKETMGKSGKIVRQKMWVGVKGHTLGSSRAQNYIPIRCTVTMC